MHFFVVGSNVAKFLATFIVFTESRIKIKTFTFLFYKILEIEEGMIILFIVWILNPTINLLLKINSHVYANCFCLYSLSLKVFFFDLNPPITCEYFCATNLHNVEHEFIKFVQCLVEKYAIILSQSNG